MARLLVKELAERRGMNMSQLLAALNRRLPADPPLALTTLRRYWHSTKDGKETGPPIELVDITVLAAAAAVLGVRLGDLFDETELAKALEQ